MRIPNVILLLLLCGISAQASAGNLYRCLGSDGIPNYTSKKVAGSTCTVVAKSSPEPSPKPAPVAVTPAAAPTPAVVVTAPVANSTSASTTASTQEGATVITAPTTTPAVNTVQAASKPKATSTSAPKFLKMGQSTTYAYVDENGIKNYSSRKPKGIANVVATRIEYPIFSQPNCYACGVTASAVNFGSVKLNTLAYAAEIKAASQTYGVEEAVVRAIIHAESAYRPHVQSNKGAQGLMQLIPATARRFGVSDSFDPAQNIDGGVQYLAWLLKRYGQDVTLAAAAYNAGEGAVDKYGGVPPYRETQNYVVRVGQLAERYRKAL